VQPRLETSSTVSTDCLLSPAIRNVAFSDLNKRHSAHLFVLALAMGRVRRFATEAFD
jgi:hypothetical protein